MTDSGDGNPEDEPPDAGADGVVQAGSAESSERSGAGDADAAADDSAPPDDAAQGDESAERTVSAEGTDSAERDVEALREEVEAKYDFDDFGPADMRQMTAEEWEVAFDAETWITGEALLDRVQTDLEARIASRDVFAVLERVEVDGADRLLAYSDEGYAVVYPDGTVEGEGTVRRDVEPSVALCSMEDYTPNEPPADPGLPDPDDVASGTGEFGNWMLQVVAGAQVLVGVGLLGAWLFTDLSTIVAPVAALGFVLVGVFLLAVVANARLADRFRAEEYRERLRAVGTGEGERPAFVPDDEDLATPPTDGKLLAGEAGEGGGPYDETGGDDEIVGDTDAEEAGGDAEADEAGGTADTDAEADEAGGNTDDTGPR